MFEKPGHRPVRSALALACAAAALAGCSNVGSDTAVSKKVAVERCFDQPLPKTKPAHLSTPPESTAISLHYNPSSKFLSEAPAIDESLRQKLIDSNVRIKAGDLKGSGFITKAPDGSEVAITAAHVISVDDLSQITIHDSQGQTTTASDACYIYEAQGAFTDLDSTYTEKDRSGLEDVDLAILRLAKPLGSTPLKIASSFPNRGTWVEFVNSQGHFDAEYPAEYTGLVVSQPNSRDLALTGLEPWQKDIDGESAYSIEPGASGGLVASVRTGEVVGISYGGSKGYNTAESTSALYGVQFNAPVGHETGIIPVEADIVGAEVLHHALASTRY